MGRSNAECQGNNGKWTYAGCIVQEGKRIDGEELLKIRQAKQKIGILEECLKEKKKNFAFFVCLFVLRKKYV